MDSKTKSVKLSSTQIWVIDRMQNDWELGHTKGYFAKTRIQKGGIGRGGESLTVSFATFNKLRSLGLIKVYKEGYPTDKYELTDLAKTLKL